MNILIQTFEVVILGISFVLVIHFWNAGTYNRYLIVYSLSLLTVTVGEIVNFFITGVTLYNRDFLLLLPCTEIPVSIIAAGALLSTVLFRISMFVPGKSYFLTAIKRICVVLLLSLFLPLLEIMGIKTGMWYWIRPCHFNFFWCTGVWEFYFIFIVFPVILTHLLAKCCDKSMETGEE